MLKLDQGYTHDLKSSHERNRDYVKLKLARPADCAEFSRRTRE